MFAPLLFFPPFPLQSNSGGWLLVAYLRTTTLSLEVLLLPIVNRHISLFYYPIRIPMAPPRGRRGRVAAAAGAAAAAARSQPQQQWQQHDEDSSDSMMSDDDDGDNNNDTSTANRRRRGGGAVATMDVEEDEENAVSSPMTTTATATSRRGGKKLTAIRTNHANNDDSDNDVAAAAGTNNNDEDEDESILKILLSTDNHLGYCERDPIRTRDSFAAFEEMLYVARQSKVDMVLLSGDLFHENKPSRKTLHTVS